MNLNNVEKTFFDKGEIRSFDGAIISCLEFKARRDKLFKL